MSKIIIILLILSGLGYFIYSNVNNSKTYIDHDTVIKGNYQLDKNKDVVMVAGSKLTVEGDAVIDGKLDCDKGPIYLEVKGSVQVNGSLGCKRESEEAANKVGMGIVLITGGKIEFSNLANIATNGHIQIVDNLADIAKTDEEIDKVYEEALSDTDQGAMRIGPFIPESKEGSKRGAKQTLNLKNLFPGTNFIKTAQAADDKADVTLNGHWKIDPPPEGVRRLIFYINEKAKSIEINGSIEGPSGRNGKEVKGGCDINIPKIEEDDQAKGGALKKSKDALVTRIRAGKVYLGEFTLKLGDGGRGGDATSSNDCYPDAKAIAGDGGKSGNLKITAETEITVKKRFTILPGKGGRGGDAIASGKSGDSGDPAQDGASTFAQGGNGADNIVSLRSVGNVNGLDKVYVGSVIAGDGGDATVHPGNGGKGVGKMCYGGLRGVSQAIAGKGGKASFTYPPTIQDTDDAYDHDGKGGQKTVNEAKDGDDDPSCNPPAKAAPSQPAKASGNSAKSTSSSSKGLTGRIYFFHGSQDSGYTSNSDPAGAAYAALVSNYPSSLPREAGGVKWSYYTPLKVEVIVGNKLVWQGTLSSSNCNDEMSEASCSIDGYKYNSAWDPYSFEMNVYDKDGQLRAHFVPKKAPWRPSCSGVSCPSPFISAPKP